jgi:hypothetical protein
MMSKFALVANVRLLPTPRVFRAPGYSEITSVISKLNDIVMRSASAAVPVTGSIRQWVSAGTINLKDSKQVCVTMLLLAICQSD